MKSKVIDGFLLLGSSLSQNGQKTFEMSRPILQDVFTTEVKVSVIILNLHFLSLQNMHVQFEYLLTQKWYDPRLDSDVRTRKLATNGHIWKPKIIPMEGEHKEIESTQFFRGESPSGKILYSEKVVLKTFCSNNLHSFPFDSQHCVIKLSSYRFPVEEVELVWEDNSVEWKDTNVITEFQIKNTENNSFVESRPSGNFSALSINITLKRDFKQYIFTTFTLPGFLVCVSYFVFWIHRNRMNFRLILSLINMTILIFLFINSTNFTFNNILKASNVFLLICIVFVCLTLVVNIIIDYFWSTNIEEHKYEPQHEENRYDPENEENKYETENEDDDKNWPKLDFYCIILYPTLFLSCIIIYFIAYTS